MPRRSPLCAPPTWRPYDHTYRFTWWVSGWPKEGRCSLPDHRPTLSRSSTCATLRRSCCCSPTSVRRRVPRSQPRPLPFFRLVPRDCRRHGWPGGHRTRLGGLGLACSAGINSRSCRFGKGPQRAHASALDPSRANARGLVARPLAETVMQLHAAEAVSPRRSAGIDSTGPRNSPPLGVGSSLTGARGGARSVKADRRHSVPIARTCSGAALIRSGARYEDHSWRPSNRRNGTIDPGLRIALARVERAIDAVGTAKWSLTTSHRGARHVERMAGHLRRSLEAYARSSCRWRRWSARFSRHEGPGTGRDPVPGQPQGTSVGLDGGPSWSENDSGGRAWRSCAVPRNVAAIHAAPGTRTSRSAPSATQS